MNTGDGIAIKRDNTLTGACVYLFEWLHTLTLSEIMVYNDDRSKLQTVKKKPDEIVKLDFAYEPLTEKFYAFSFSGKEWWYLNKEETILLLRCCYTGYYYLGKQHQ